ncbi:LysR family transcriptional regulator [Azospirillum lipoferum]|uniref:Transcriptional regulator (LysR family) n=1 Tax=Azospirillum lipoferum (strain 4B) TaxID=862719 RepID=G7ZC81_AZOL4|nr:LysR family transcriptional regulator [Azospirillum lipoferum]CBS89183.1 transcriptional regulator (LysR family) [Azospirillum lipoferum 4B]
MELRHLRYFQMVAAERSFTRAAERLHIAQPPLSRQIRQLEEELGTELLVRGSRPLELTEAGRLLYEHAIQVLDRVDDIHWSLRALGGSRRTVYPIGLVGSILYGSLPRVLRRFRASRPDLDVRLIEMTTLEQLPALRDHRIAVGFGRLPFQEPGIVQQVLHDEPLVAAMSCECPLAAGTGPVPLAALVRETLLVYPRKPRPSYADQVLALFRDRGLLPNAVVEAGELQTALGLVACGVGLCLVPESASGSRGDLIYRPIAERAITSPMIVSTRAGDDNEATAALLAMVTE